MRSILVCATAIGNVSFAHAGNSVTAETPKKIIYYGWGIRDSQYVRDHWQTMETLPFDGTAIAISRDRVAPNPTTTTNLLGWHVTRAASLDFEDYRAAVEDLRTPAWQRFTENFLAIALSSSVSGPVPDWFDDDGWNVIRDNFAVMARIAAEGRLRGLILDPEHYGDRLFHHRVRRGGPSFTQTASKVRQRGREVGTAIGKSLPRGVLLSLYGHSLALRDLRRGHRLHEAPYGLFPAFLDGLLEGLPSKVAFVDGFEFAYGYREPEQFRNAYREIREEARTLSSDPTRYARQVSVGFGLWLDYRRSTDYHTPESFPRTLTAALETSDRYVWLYSEAIPVFPPHDSARPLIASIETVRSAFRR